MGWKGNGNSSKIPAKESKNFTAQGNEKQKGSIENLQHIVVPLSFHVIIGDILEEPMTYWLSRSEEEAFLPLSVPDLYWNEV